MSNGKQKTFDAQTAKFLAVVSENMPRLDSEWMQEWIQNPKLLQKMLSRALSEPCMEDYRHKSASGEPSLEELEELMLSVEEVRCTGVNPFTVVGTDLELIIAPEYLYQGENDKLMLRPILVLTSKDLTNFWSLKLIAMDCFRNHEKWGIQFDRSHVFSLLENENSGLSGILWDLETAYANQVLKHIEKNYPVKISVVEGSSVWTIHFNLMKDGATLVTNVFQLPKKLLSEQIQKATQIATVSSE